MELDRAAVLANDHQHIDRRGGRWVSALAGQRVNIHIALRSKPTTNGTARNVLTEQEAIDFSF